MPEYLNLSTKMYDGIGEYNIPIIQPVYELPKIDKWLEFEIAKNKRNKPKNTGIHFFEYDFKFESVWNFPDRYIDVFKQYDCVLQPDFSMYIDFPKAVRIFNKYRNHWLSAYWQDNGITVIPVIRTGDLTDWDWAFDGYPMESIVAVSNIGCNQKKDAKEFWIKGYNEMLKRLKPSKILFYSNSYPTDLDGNIHFIKYNIDKSIGR